MALDNSAAALLTRPARGILTDRSNASGDSQKRRLIQAHVAVRAAIRSLPRVVITIEPAPHHGWLLVGVCGRHRRASRFAVALLSTAESMADELARSQGWGRA